MLLLSDHVDAFWPERLDSFEGKPIRSITQGGDDLSAFEPEVSEADAPADWTAFRDKIRASDAVLFVTPEYNRSMPGVLKNAIDVGSRPFGKSVYDKKPAAVVSVSPGAMSAFGANHHLRQSLVFLNMPAMQQPEVYLGGVDKLFGPDGKLANPSTKEFLGKVMQAFAVWIEKTGS